MNALLSERHEQGSRARLCRLIPLDGRGKRSTPIPVAFPAILGRGLHADVRVEDPWVSRIHCELCEREGRLIVQDLDSRHGVFVNDERVEEADLISGDVLRIGVTSFIIDRYGFPEWQDDYGS